MADLRTIVFRVAIATSFLHACGGDDSNHIGSSRALDSACANGRCKTSGSAKPVLGPTNDSLGFHIGPDAGTVDISVSGIRPKEGDTIWSYEALVAGQGTFEAHACDVSCETNGYTHHVGTDYRWLTIASDGEGGSLPARISVANLPGSEIDIADVRIVSTYPVTCSISRAGPR